MLDSIVIGVACFLVVLLVDKLVPVAERWKKALITGAIAGIIVVIWFTIKPA